MAHDTEFQDEEMQLDDIDFMEPANRSLGSSRVLWILGGALLGVAAMYLLDPVDGRRRRSSLGERVKEYGKPIYKMANEALHRKSSEAVADATRH